MNWLFQASRKISNLLTVAYLFIISSKNNKRQTQMLQKKKRKETPKDESYTEVNNYKKMK